MRYIGILLLLLSLTAPVLADDDDDDDSENRLLALEAAVEALENTDAMINESVIFNDKYRVAYNSDGAYLGEIVREHLTGPLCHVDFAGAGESALIPMYEQYNGAYAWPVMAAFADENCTESIVRTDQYDKYPASLPKYTHALIQYHIETDVLYVKKVDFSTRFNSNVYMPAYNSRTRETNCELRYSDEKVYAADNEEFYWGLSAEITISYVDELP